VQAFREKALLVARSAGEIARRRRGIDHSRNRRLSVAIDTRRACNEERHLMAFEKTGAEFIYEVVFFWVRFP